MNLWTDIREIIDANVGEERANFYKIQELRKKFLKIKLDYKDLKNKEMMWIQ